MMWIIPAIITAAALAWAIREDRAARPFCRAEVRLIAGLVASCVSLVAWLIWALVR